MKKCKWCEAKIEDDVATCPFCRANQEIEYDDTTQKNHVEDFLKNIQVEELLQNGNVRKVNQL